jgi:cell division protein FtsL
LSTLTKVLIVLLTVVSLFLSGIVVTYVSNADNWQKKANEFRTQSQNDKNKRDKAQTDLADGLKDAKVREDGLNSQVATLTAQIKKLEEDLLAAKRENNQLVQQGASLAAAAQANSTGEKEQRALFDQEHKKVQALESDRINRVKELTETSESLLQKVALITQLQDQVRQLTQENQDLGNRVNQYLVQYGKIAAKPPTTVAPGSGGVRPVPQPIAAVTALTKNIGLNGRVTDVDLQHRMVEISVGAAAGVRQDMIFYITRGDQYVANIKIMEALPDKAVGILDLVQPGLQPQAGDKAATNL